MPSRIRSGENNILSSAVKVKVPRLGILIHGSPAAASFPILSEFCVSLAQNYRDYLGLAEMLNVINENGRTTSRLAKTTLKY